MLSGPLININSGKPKNLSLFFIFFIKDISFLRIYPSAKGLFSSSIPIFLPEKSPYLRFQHQAPALSSRRYQINKRCLVADLLNDRVLPFFDDQGVSVLRVLTDRGTEYCGVPERHPYEVFLQYQEIEHTKTRARRPQSNGICESFHKTVLNEFYSVAFRKKIYPGVEELQKDLDEWLEHYNNNRTHQGKRCQGRTPMDRFMASLDLARQKNLDKEFNGVSDACQL